MKQLCDYFTRYLCLSESISKYQQLYAVCLFVCFLFLINNEADLAVRFPPNSDEPVIVEVCESVIRLVIANEH